jgi:hypothetical protein
VKALARFKLIREIVRHRSGSGAPHDQHAIKLAWIDYFRNVCGVNVMVETGTYYGQTVEAMLRRFKCIYTIELAPDLWEMANEKFERFSHVHVMRGNSADILPKIINEITERCLFWLDGHFSGVGTARGPMDSPIAGELAAIRRHALKNHVILIDDARLFNGTNGYMTLQETFCILKEINARYTVRVKDDMIQAYC